MNILHVETGRHLYGGPQQVVYLLAALAERGIDGTLVCPPDSAIEAAACASNLRVHSLRCAGDLDVRFAYRLGRSLKEIRPDIVHCHSRRGADLLGGMAASLAGIPAVVSRRVDNPELRPLAALRYRAFARVVAVSAAVAAMLGDHGIDAGRVVVIPDAVDTERFARQPDAGAFRAEFDLPEESVVIAAAGQLIPRKGHRFLLQAVADLKERHPALRVLVFGAGALADELRAQAGELGLGGVVRFAGFRDDLDEWYACFDIFAHPALAEGLGVATLKAQAAGVPVVGFAAGGVVEAVAHGETGLLVPAGSAGELRDALDRLLDDAGLRRRMGAAGRARMRAQFSIAAMADRHIALYESVLNA